MNTIKDFAAIDMFCGVGGLTHGLIKCGFEVVAGYDIDPSCKYAFEYNNHASFIHKDIKKVDALELNELYASKHKILVGCAPCQPFSPYSNKNIKKREDDDKWQLLYQFSRLVKEVCPLIISMENVPQLAQFEKGKVLNDFIAELECMEYKVSWSIVNAQDYGVPQRRKRLVLLASKMGGIMMIQPTHKDKPKTVRDAIGNLPSINDGESDGKDFLHKSRKLSDLNKKRIQATQEGGFWRDWDESLWLDCHKKPQGKSFGSVYGRMKWDEAAPTMTTHCIGLGNGRFGHPSQDRAISLREAALIQSFPLDYQFYTLDNPLASATVARQIGNAVPVDLGKAIGESIKQHLIEFNMIDGKN